jgi:hypothetical protein
MMCATSRWMLILVATVLALSCTTSGPSEVSQPEDQPRVEEEKAEPKKQLVNTIRWTTASEVENFGFDIYRSTSENGPFERITKDPIPGAGTTDEPQSYVYVDDSIDPSHGYYYYLESISMQGVRERFSPINYSPPKIVE